MHELAPRRSDFGYRTLPTIAIVAPASGIARCAAASQEPVVAGKPEIVAGAADAANLKELGYGGQEEDPKELSHAR